jgi:CRP-like cAMP-binding protein
LRQGREVTKVACEGDVVGAVDFLNELPRISTANVIGDKLVVYSLRKEDFKKIIDKPAQSRYQELKNVAILGSMTDGQLRVLEKQIALKDCVKGGHGFVLSTWIRITHNAANVPDS